MGDKEGLVQRRGERQAETNQEGCAHVQERWIAAGRARGPRRSDVFFRPREVEFGSFPGPALRSSGSRGRGQNFGNGSAAGNLKTRTGSSGAYAGEAPVR